MLNNGMMQAGAVICRGPQRVMGVDYTSHPGMKITGWDMAQLLECLPSVYKTQFLFPAPYKSGMVAHDYRPIIKEGKDRKI